MEQAVLADKNQFPTEEVTYSHIGKSKALWLSLFKYIHENHPDFTEQWRYYLDGQELAYEGDQEVQDQSSGCPLWRAPSGPRSTFGDKAGILS